MPVLSVQRVNSDIGTIQSAVDPTLALDVAQQNAIDNAKRRVSTLLPNELKPKSFEATDR